MSSPFFPNAKNLLISGGQFNINNHHHSSINRDGFGLLREYCALGAILDSRERFDPPRCAPATREALIQGVLAWIYSGDESASMAWLFGGAGAGKSALAQTIAEILQMEGRLAGSFFFSRTSTAERSDGNRLIPTLVFQLMNAFPLLRPHVEECIHAHGGLLDRSARTQMDLLFIGPLISLKRQTMAIQTLSTPMSQSSSLSTFSESESQRCHLHDVATTSHELDNLLRPRLIVIDGLDECSGQDLQIDLLQILARAIPRLPIPLRFLVASRPEGPISRTFDFDESFQSLNVYKISLSDNENADNDIRRFLMRGFQEIRRTHPLRTLLSPSWPSQNDINALVLKSSSHFIYASTAMKYIQYPRGRPSDRLEVILGLSVPPITDKPFAQLDALYTHIFMSMDEPDRVTVNTVFGIMYLAGVYDRIRQSPLKLEEYMGMRAGEIHLLLEPLFSLVALPDDREAAIKVLHASLFDFLLDASRSGGLCLDLRTAHGTLAEFWVEQIRQSTLDSTFENVLKTLNICPSFLTHCLHGVLSENVKEYLRSFPFFYDGILHSMFFKFLKDDTSSIQKFCVILRILEMFFDILINKGFNDGQRLHTLHAMQIGQRLQSVRQEHGYGGSPLLDNITHEPLFNNILHQNLRFVCKSFLNMYLPLKGKFSLSGILDNITRWHNGIVVGGNVLSHCMIISLPYLTQRDVYFCVEYAEKIKIKKIHSDVRLVLEERVAEYLQRVEPDADPLDLSECKQAWGIT